MIVLNLTKDMILDKFEWRTKTLPTPKKLRFKVILTLKSSYNYWIISFLNPQLQTKPHPKIPPTPALHTQPPSQNTNTTHQTLSLSFFFQIIKTEKKKVLCDYQLVHILLENGMLPIRTYFSLFQCGLGIPSLC